MVETSPATSVARTLHVLRIEPESDPLVLSGDVEVTPALAEALQVLRLRVLDHGEPAEVTVTCGDRDFRATVIPFPESDGNLGRRALAIVSSVDSAEAASSTLRAEQHQTLCRLVCGMVHELRNPLASISLLAELLALRPDIHDPVREKLGDIVHHVERAEEVLQSLRRFGREETNAKRPTSLNELVRDAVRLERSLATAKGVDLVVDLDADLPPVLADPSQLRVAIANLVRNGVESMPDGTAGGKVFVRTARRHGVLRIVVEDEGTGIPPRALRHIFEANVTSKKSGTGLGLPIALGIVRAHGGHLWAENRRRRGARFLVDLPDPQHSTPARIESVLGIDLTQGPTRAALVVDPDEERLERHRSAIAAVGWKVHVAHNAAIAMRKLRASDFDALLVADSNGGEEAVDLCARSRLAHPELTGRLIVMLERAPSLEIHERIRLVGARIAIGAPDEVDFPGILAPLAERCADKPPQ